MIHYVPTATTASVPPSSTALEDSLTDWARVLHGKAADGGLKLFSPVKLSPQRDGSAHESVSPDRLLFKRLPLSKVRLERQKVVVSENLLILVTAPRFFYKRVTSMP